jgi:hypothetical protein
MKSLARFLYERICKACARGWQQRCPGKARHLIYRVPVVFVHGRCGSDHIRTSPKLI